MGWNQPLTKKCRSENCGNRIPDSHLYCSGCLTRLRETARDTGILREHVPVNGEHGPEKLRQPYIPSASDRGPIRRIGSLSHWNRVSRNTMVFK